MVVRPPVTTTRDYVWTIQPEGYSREYTYTRLQSILTWNAGREARLLSWGLEDTDGVMTVRMRVIARDRHAVGQVAQDLIGQAVVVLKARATPLVLPLPPHTSRGYAAGRTALGNRKRARRDRSGDS